MSRPKAYDPQDGYMFQILCRDVRYSREWEHCDYATDISDKNHLMSNYGMAYHGTGMELMWIPLPRKYWDKEKVAADTKKRNDERREKWRANRLQVTADGQLVGL